MNHDDEPMPDSLRSVIDVLRAPAPLPDDAADAPLRAQVRTMVRAMVPVLPDPPASSGSAAGPPKAPRGPWQRTVPLATFGVGLCVGAVLHAALATPQVRVVTRQGEWRGRAVGIDDQGALLLEREQPDGLKVVEGLRGGDVHLLPPDADPRDGGADARAAR